MNVSRAKERTVWVDYLRGTGILLMIIGHTVAPAWLIKWIYGFHMPLFYILSGYLYNDSKWDKKGYKDFCISKIRSLLIPYCIWCILCFLVNLPLLYAEYHQNGFFEAVLQNIGWILTSIRIDGVFLPQNCTPLWFLTSLFISQQVFFWIKRLHIKYQCVFAVLFIFMNYVLIHFSIPVLPWHLDVSLIGALFMMAGYCMKKHRVIERNYRHSSIAACFIIANACIIFNTRTEIYYRNYGNFFLFFLGATLMAFSLMWFFSRQRRLFGEKSITLFGQYSMIILGINYSVNRYVNHFAKLASKFLFPVSVNWAILSFINFVIGGICICLFIKLSKKFTRLELLIGR